MRALYDGHSAGLPSHAPGLERFRRASRVALFALLDMTVAAAPRGTPTSSRRSPSSGADAPDPSVVRAFEVRRTGPPKAARALRRSLNVRKGASGAR